MEKIFTALLLTLVVSVLGIPAAYFVGWTSARESLRAEYRQELERARSEQNDVIASLQAQVAATVTAPRRNEPAARPEPAIAPVKTAQALVTGEVDSPEGGDLPIPEETIDAAAPGMPYEDVVERFGREGEPVLTLEEGTGTVTTQYVWGWRGADGTPGRVLIEFVDGRLTDKSIED
jgi:hypothetical protein